MVTLVRVRTLSANVVSESLIHFSEGFYLYFPHNVGIPGLLSRHMLVGISMGVVLVR